MSSISIDRYQQQSSEARLHLYSSLIKEKELFVPINGNEVRWYSYGSNFRRKIDMNVVRYYVTSDILRRVMQNYFGYDVVYYFNVNDIDEKILGLANEQKLKKVVNKNSHREASSTSFEEKAEGDELIWKAKWGYGRPASEVHCSAIANFVSSTNFDICSSNSNLNSVRHDNDAAQLQAFSGVICD